MLLKPGNNTNYDDCDVKTPLVDLVADSPSSIQDDNGDASDYFLNSNLFLNTNDVQDTNYIDEKNDNIITSNEK